eukprot:2244337-Rhodomonas_salina.1
MHRNGHLRTRDKEAGREDTEMVFSDREIRRGRAGQGQGTETRQSEEKLAGCSAVTLRRAASNTEFKNSDGVLECGNSRVLHLVRTLSGCDFCAFGAASARMSRPGLPWHQESGQATVKLSANSEPELGGYPRASRTIHVGHLSTSKYPPCCCTALNASLASTPSAPQPRAIQTKTRQRPKSGRAFTYQSAAF